MISDRSTHDLFVSEVANMLIDTQENLYREAKTLLDSNIRNDIKSMAELSDYFGASSGEDEEAVEFTGWVRAPWAAPTGAKLDKVEAQLKASKLTIRNAPLDQPESVGQCIFTGEDGVEEVLIARSY